MTRSLVGLHVRDEAIAHHWAPYTGGGCWPSPSSPRSPLQAQGTWAECRFQHKLVLRPGRGALQKGLQEVPVTRRCVLRPGTQARLQSRQRLTPRHQPARRLQRPLGRRPRRRCSARGCWQRHWAQHCWPWQPILSTADLRLDWGGHRSSTVPSDVILYRDDFSIIGRLTKGNDHNDAGQRYSKYLYKCTPRRF